MDRIVAEPSVIRLARERPFRLGAVEVRPATREVIGRGARAVLEPRVMQVLVALVQARGEIVTRDDLTTRCWEGRIVGEDAISKVISRLRRLTETVGGDSWTLETVTKVGYRLLPKDAAAADPLALPPPPPARPSRRLLLGAGGGLIVAAAGAAAWWRFGRRPVSSKARVLYEKGRDAMRPGLPEGNAQAQGFLREAVADSPQFAEAWGALAIAYQQSLAFTPPAEQDGVTVLAQAAARRALELDSNDPQGLAALALLAPSYRNWVAAERLYQRALARHARDSDVEFIYARMLTEVGRMKPAVERAQASVSADEFAVWHHHILAMALWGAGRLEEADLRLQRALQRWPRHYALWFLQFNVLTFSGRPGQALAMAADPATWPANIPAADMALSIAMARAVATRSARDVASAVEGHLAAARRGPGFAANAIDCLSVLGRLDEAFAVARALYFNEGWTMPEQRFSTSRYDVGKRRRTNFLFMPPVAALHADPRFARLVQDIGIADYWRATRTRPDSYDWRG